MLQVNLLAACRLVLQRTEQKILRYFCGSQRTQNAVCGPLRSLEKALPAAFRCAIQLEVRPVCVIIIN